MTKDTRQLRSWTEILLAGSLFAALLVGPFIRPANRVLLMKPLWFDELCTWLLARTPPGPTLLSQLRHGGEFNPPLLFFIDSISLRVFPFLPTQLVLRCTSLLAAWFSMLLVYWICRERMGVFPAVIGGIA